MHLVSQVRCHSLILAPDPTSPDFTPHPDLLLPGCKPAREPFNLEANSPSPRIPLEFAPCSKNELFVTLGTERRWVVILVGLTRQVQLGLGRGLPVRTVPENETGVWTKGGSVSGGDDTS